MILLRLAAMIAAAVTVALNAHHGYTSASTLAYAVMFALLNAALDIAKCTLIPIGMRAVRTHSWTVAFVAFGLFPLLFANSVWNAVSQVAISRDAGKATAVAGLQTRQRAESEHKRLLAELALMQQSETFKATAACTRAINRVTRPLCDTVARTKTDIKATEAALAAIAPIDPQPQVTLLASLSGSSIPLLTFVLAVMPVLLAELLGSVGFFIAAQPASSATERPQRRFRLPMLGQRRGKPKTPPSAASMSSPTMVWKLPASP